MSLIHRAEQVTADIVTLECHNCRARYAGDALDELLAVDDELLRCDDCGVSGLIPHRVSQIEDRFPGGAIARGWTPLPVALFDHREALGIGSNELLVIWALERHRPRIYPSQAGIAAMTGLSIPTVKRAIGALVKADLIVREQYRWRATGRRANNRYDVSRLWRRVAELERGEGARDHSDPWTGDQGDPLPGIRVIPELDLSPEVDLSPKESPNGTSPATPDLAAIYPFERKGAA